MPNPITTINLGGVNCFLLQGQDGYVLIDTGYAARRSALLKALDAAGCVPGKLRLVILTHGDSDHIGNAPYLRETYGAEIAMGEADAAMAEQSNMGLGRKPKPDRFPLVFRLLGTLNHSESAEGFTPDLFLEDGQNLNPYGIDAQVVALPGHSRGSIGVLTGDSELFCGDLLMNTLRPRYHFLVDDMPTARASVQRLAELEIVTIYPGHGRPFSARQLPDA